MKARINIYLKDGVLDPAGKATQEAIKNLGFSGIQNLRIGKQICLDIDAKNYEEAKNKIEQICNDLLVNLVIEDYEIEL